MSKTAAAPRPHNAQDINLVELFFFNSELQKHEI